MESVTLLNEVFEMFYDKIKKHKSFFKFCGDTEEESIQIIKKRTLGLLELAISNLLVEIEPQISFEIDYENETFKDELTKIEKDILTDLMYICLEGEERALLEAKQIWYNKCEIDGFSPANERDSFLGMVSNMEDKVEAKIFKYNSKDRLTGKYRELEYNL